MSKREKDQEQKAAQAASEHAESAEVPEDIVPEEPAAGTQDPLPEELEHLKASLSAKEEQYLRLAAEYDNFRKRSQKEKESIYADAKADALTAFLPVYDNLERALKQETADEAYAKGVQMTMLSGGSSVRRMRPSMGRPPAKFSILKMSSLPSAVWRKASS